MKLLNFEKIEKSLKYELEDIEKDLEKFREDEKFFGKDGVDYDYKHELITRRSEVLGTIKLVQKLKQDVESAVERLLKEINKMWNEAHDKQIEDAKVFSYYDGYKQACEDLEKKVKKAFVGVVEK